MLTELYHFKGFKSRVKQDAPTGTTGTKKKKKKAEECHDLDLDLVPLPQYFVSRIVCNYIIIPIH